VVAATICGVVGIEGRAPTGTRKAWITWVAGFVLAFGSLLGWAFASSPGSSPDDDFHLVSTWCALGPRDGICEPGATAGTREVPAAVVAATCNAQQMALSSACTLVRDPSEMTTVDRGNWGGLYPPVYYAVTGIFASPDVGASTIAIRAFNSLLFLAVVGLLLIIGPPMLRRFAVVAPIVTAIPLGAFIIASTNPSSWAVASALAVSGSLILLPRVSGWRQWAAAGLAVVGALIGAGARADSAVATIVAVVVALVLGLRRDRASILLACAGAAAVAVAALFLLGAAQSAAAATGLGAGPPTSAGSFVDAVRTVLTEVPQLLVGVFGVWALGWFDAPVGALVWVAASAVFAVAMWTALRHLDWRRSTALAIAAIGVYGYPLALLVQSRAPVGELVQPRYVLPLIVVLAVTALASRPVMSDVAGLRSAQRWLPVAGLAAANAVALRTTIHRYTTGSGDPATSGGEWWWPGSGIFSPTVTWLLAAAAFAGLLVLLAWRRRAEAPLD